MRRALPLLLVSFGLFAGHVLHLRPAVAASDGGPTLVAGPHIAARLDAKGKLAEALPIYLARAQQTMTVADRLRYTGALLRAGQAQKARAVYDELLREDRPTAHDRAATGTATLPTLASHMLRTGFPALAVEYLRPAWPARRGDAAFGLLYARALLAAGDRATARGVIDATAKGNAGWPVGTRIELGRTYLLAGDAKAARAILDGDISESTGQMMRDSIVANVSFTAEKWSDTAEQLNGAKRKGPAALDDPKVSRAWRNVQRELRSIQLRRAVSLWNAGKREPALLEARDAQQSDEELVRSGAVLLLTAGDLAAGRRAAAKERLRLLGAHDVRFAEPTSALRESLKKAREPARAIAALREVLASQDRAQDFVTKPLLDVLADAARQTSSEGVARP